MQDFAAIDFETANSERFIGLLGGYRHRARRRNCR